MAETIKNREEAGAWLDLHDPLAPKAEDPAPDFELLDVSGSESVRLSQFRGDRPVALVFGSFT